MPPRNPFPLTESPTNIRRHFESVPWAIKLFDDPTLQPFDNTFCEPDSNHNSFVGRSLKGGETIAAWQSFKKIKDAGKGKAHEHPEVVAVLKLGSGVNGHHDTCHGGFVSLLLDEVSGNAAEHSKPTDNSSSMMMSMTAYLNVRYKKPVRTPGIILTRGSVVRREGRKLFVTASVEDGEGGMLATADSLFIMVQGDILSSKL